MNYYMNVTELYTGYKLAFYMKLRGDKKTAIYKYGNGDSNLIIRVGAEAQYLIATVGIYKICGNLIITSQR